MIARIPRFAWNKSDHSSETRERLKSLGPSIPELEERDYGQIEFFVTDVDGHSHWFRGPDL
jgi:hypothetical protein